MIILQNIISTISVLIFIALLTLLYWLSKKQVSFNKRLLLGLTLGIIYGLSLQLLANHLWGNISLKIIQDILGFVGNIYLSLLKMIVIPLVLLSIIHAIISLGNKSQSLLTHIALKSVAMLLIMTSIASAIGIGVGLLFHVGEGLHLPDTPFSSSYEYTGILPTLLGMLPSNPIAAMTHGNVLAIAIFAVFLGIGALLLYKSDSTEAKTFHQFISATFHVIKKLVAIIIGLSPYGVLALMMNMSMTQGIKTLEAVIIFIIAMYIAMALVIMMHLLILFFSGQNPLTYFAA